MDYHNDNNNSSPIHKINNFISLILISVFPLLNNWINKKQSMVYWLKLNFNNTGKNKLLKLPNHSNSSKKSSPNNSLTYPWLNSN